MFQVPFEQKLRMPNIHEWVDVKPRFLRTAPIVLLQCTENVIARRRRCSQRQSRKCRLNMVACQAYRLSDSTSYDTAGGWRTLCADWARNTAQIFLEQQLTISCGTATMPPVMTVPAPTTSPWIKVNGQSQNERQIKGECAIHVVPT